MGKTPPIQVFVRHAYYSRASFHKPRLPKFSPEKCYRNLIATTAPSEAKLTFLLDTHFGEGQDHFLKEQSNYPVIEINGGCEASSFLQMLDYVTSHSFAEETPIYFLEDDYLHRPGWAQILSEGLSLPSTDYLTLFDDQDKYTDPRYETLRSQIFHTESCHWRTTPSTTNTYAMRFSTLKKHLPVHQKYSEDREISADHEKFCALTDLGATLISSIPGFATHIDPGHISPCHVWEKYFKKPRGERKFSPLQKLLGKKQ